MSAQVNTQQTRRAEEGKRGRGGRKGGSTRRGARGGGDGTAGGRPGAGKDSGKAKQGQDHVEQKDEEITGPTAAAPTVTATGAEGAEEDDDVCWICAELVKYWSVSECNHRTCHVCALRLRALYKKTDCTFCKVGFNIPLRPRCDLI